MTSTPSNKETLMFGQIESKENQTGTTATPVKTNASRGLAATFGLDPRVAVLTVIVDMMVFGGDAITLGALIPIGIGVGAIMGLIVYKIQVKWYGDDRDSALIKALIVGLLTAIPAPLGPFFAIPGGLLGILKALRGR
jgi:hypothetical protein